jgi:hypothetical protein
MSQPLIRSLFESRLKPWAASKSLPVAWQNAAFVTPAGTFIEAFLLPSTTISLDIAKSHRAYTGTFQISIVASVGTGMGAIEALAGEVASLFPAGLRLTSSSFAVQIASPASIAAAIQASDYITLPVSFGYRADTA